MYTHSKVKKQKPKKKRNGSLISHFFYINDPFYILYTFIFPEVKYPFKVDDDTIFLLETNFVVLIQPILTPKASPN